MPLSPWLHNLLRVISHVANSSVVSPIECVHKKPHRGIEPGCGSLTLLAAAQTAVVAQTAMGTGTAGAAAFGVFCWLEVMDFDLFFGFLLFFCLVLHVLVFLVCCFCCVSDTEQVMLAFNVLFWNQVVQANQSVLAALGPLIS